MAKRFRPFWNYDILHTERWLAEMDQKGYALTDVHFATRTFVFEEGAGGRSSYRIAYDKTAGGQLPQSLAEAGWQIVSHNRRFYMLKNDRTPISEYLSYRGVLKRNESIALVLGAILLVLLIIVLPILLIFAPEMAYEGGPFVISFEVDFVPVTISAMPFWITGAIFSLAGVWMTVACFTLIGVNSRIRPFCPLPMPTVVYRQAPHDTMCMSAKQERALRRERKLIVRRKWFWFYAPDKLETWLEGMEQKGYNLYRINEWGTRFYFLKGTPRRIKIAVDQHISAGGDYYTFHSDCGWQLVHTRHGAPSSNVSASIWYRLCDEGEASPEFYSDRESQLAFAKKHTKRVLWAFIPTVVMVALFGAEHFWLLRDEETVLMDWWFYLILLGELVFIVSFLVRTLLYYRRMKKKVENPEKS